MAAVSSSLQVYQLQRVLTRRRDAVTHILLMDEVTKVKKDLLQIDLTGGTHNSFAGFGRGAIRLLLERRFGDV